MNLFQDRGRFSRRLSFAPTDCSIHIPHAGIDALVYDSLISMSRTSCAFSAPGLTLAKPDMGCLRRWRVVLVVRVLVRAL